ncbi:MAG TPA: hypothetical protein VJ887_04390 [Actinomycetota bacterium]|nr:hypothetical protein [Actinomycetota bacterium]
MPDVKEVYEMVTKQKPSEPEALERQRTRQVRTMRNRKVGAFAVAAVIGVVAAALILGTLEEQRPTDIGTNPSPTAGAQAPVGTVTFDGSTCSMEITADRIEPGFVSFRVVNASDQRVMFDSWQILEGYTFREFAVVFERQRRLLENGKPYPTPGFFPDQETEVLYLGSDVIPANSSEIIVPQMYTPGPHAIACGRRYEGAHPSLRGFQFSGLAGPIVVR